MNRSDYQMEKINYRILFADCMIIIKNENYFLLAKKMLFYVVKYNEMIDKIKHLEDMIDSTTKNNIPF